MMLMRGRQYNYCFVQSAAKISNFGEEENEQAVHTPQEEQRF